MKIGQPFNPFRFFTGIYIPEALVRARNISPGAKLAYGRLARYAGNDGRCYPSIAALAVEIGVGARQARNYLAELENAKLIRRVSRFSQHGQISNSFEFLWHSLFEGVNDHSGEGRNDDSPHPRNDTSPKESQIEESQTEESNSDLDYPPTNRKNRDSRLDFPQAVHRQLSGLVEALAEYMTLPGEGRIYPTPRTVVDIMDAAGGATESEVIACLRYLHDARGLRVGTKHGPRHFSWFKTVVGDYFRQKRSQAYPAAPAPENPETQSGLSKAEFDFMTGVLEPERP